MDTFFSWLNMAAAASIVCLSIVFRHIAIDQNILVRVGHNAMVIFCAAVLIKAMYNTSIDVFRSDYYGILFRVAYLVTLIGQILAAHSDGATAAFKKRNVDILVAHHR